MSEIQSQARYYINSASQGNKQLRKVKSLDVKDDSKVEVVRAVGVDGGAGFQASTGGYSLTLEVYGETGKEEVDWEALKAAGEQFSFTVQAVGGRRMVFRPCRVSSIGQKGDDGGSHMRTVEVVSLNRTDSVVQS